MFSVQVSHRAAAKFVWFAVGLSFLVSSPAVAVIFGHDDRIEISQSPRLKGFQPAIAVMVANNFAITNASGRVDFDFPQLKDPNRFNVCSDQRFADQPVSPIACTGFLIGPDLLLTAGHCAINSGEAHDTRTPHCEAFSWLFDFALASDAHVETTNIDPSRLIACKQVLFVSHTYDYSASNDSYVYHQDFALIQLDHQATGRAPLTIASGAGSTGLHLGELVDLLGHPAGLPLKATMDGHVLENKDPEFFRTDLDVIGGNSGGPVFNAKNEVVGILVRAFPDDDFFDSFLGAGGVGPTASAKNACLVPNRCAQDGTHCLTGKNNVPYGSQVQRIESVLLRQASRAH